MDFHKDMTEQIQDTNYQAFFQRGKCDTLYFIDGECRDMGREDKDVETMPTCFRPTFMCCPSPDLDGGGPGPRRGGRPHVRM